ncbi:MAG: hypothetical protein CMM45_09515 [Rhodospirillaceae bacterium]|nr:hypothetical protein [Rhodospirillaceae bacterium]|tara:strand:+ start:677 stop:1312 length:636 start_codon:yes stop_codon:yes gene_type:complete
MNITDNLLKFWFETSDLKEVVKKREIWFKSEHAFDAAIRDQFLTACEAAMAGRLEKLKDDTAGCLALTLLLDQCPRNLFRHTAQAYAADARARDVARHALAQGYDTNVSPWHRVFFYLPFEHSEDLSDQDLSVELFTRLGIISSLEAAEGHREVIARFGRFPYRNGALGRTNTPDEVEFLKNSPPWGKPRAEIDFIQDQKDRSRETKGRVA